jgi:hypothetical protein
LVLLLAGAANAYTVVMRGGRLVEIPSQFIVTPATLTYETSPGIQITLSVAAIDITATEKANNESPGSLLRRIGLTSLKDTAEKRSTAAASRTITNRDLQPTLERRRESELAYEVRRKQLGLPSVEESRRQAAAESELIRMELAQKRQADEETEGYWRTRAAALRTEMAAVDAEIAWTRARLDEGPAAISGNWSGWSGVSFGTILGGGSFGRSRHGSFGNFSGRGEVPVNRPARPGVFVAPNRGPQLSGGVNFGGGNTRGRVLVNPGFRPGRSHGTGGGVPLFPVFPNTVIFGSTAGYDYSFERSALITRFNELAGARAGLNARWRELEEEARRAGASPGWLRP